MKLHIGVDAELGLTHSLSTTAANSADAPRLDGVATSARPGATPAIRASSSLPLA